MAISQEQKVDFLLKKIGFTASKTGNATDATGLSGTLTPKAGFAEAIPSPLIIANTALWNESGSIPATPPGSDTTQVKVYAPAGALRMTVDSTVANNRAFIAYTTYNNTSSARLTNWIDTQFGPDYIIQVFVNDATVSSNKLNAGGSGNNDGWFFDYSAGVLNFNDTNVPTSVTSTNVYIVGYRYVGQTGAPTSGISTFSYLDLTVERNLDVGVQGGISTFRNNIDLNADLDVDGHTNLDNISIAGVTTVANDTEFIFGSNATATRPLKIKHQSSNTRNQFSSDYIDFNIIDARFKNFGGAQIAQFFAGSAVNLFYNGTQRLSTAAAGAKVFGNLMIEASQPNILFTDTNHNNDFSIKCDNGSLQFVDSTDSYTTRMSINSSGNVSIVKDLDVDGHTNLDNISVAGVSTFTGDATFSGNVSIGGTLTYEDVTNVDSVGLLTARSGIRVTGGVIEAQAGENKIPSLYANMAALPSPSTYHGMFAHVHSTGRGYFAHGGAWYELVNADLTGRVGTGTESYFIDRLVSTSTTATSLNVTGVTTAVTVDINGDLDVDGHTNLDNVSIAGLTTMSDDLRVDGNIRVQASSGYGFVKVFDGNPSGGGSLIVGTNNDLFVYHGGHNYYDSYNNARHIFMFNGSEVACSMIPNNKVSLFYDNVAKFETATSGVKIVGTTTSTQLAITGISTFTGAIDANGDLDVDGHTNLDNVSIAGVTTAAGTLRVGTGHTFHDNGNAEIAGIATVYNKLNIPRFYGSGNPSTQLLTLGADEIRIFQRWNGSTSTIEFKNTGAFIGQPATGASAPITIQSGSFTRFKFINSNGGSGTYAEFNKSGTGGYVQLHGESNTKVLTTDANGVNILKDIDVDGHTELDNVNIVGVTTAAGHVLPSADVTYDLGSSSKQWRNLYADNIVSAPGNGFIGPDLTVRNFKATGISTFGGNARFNSTIAVHDGTTGSNGQYLKSVGTGVTWASFPTLRTRDTIVASAGQTSFTFNYTVNFIDVFVNGIKLTDSEFTATNGTSVVLAVGCFVGDIVELVSYNTVSTGAGGGGGTLNNVVEDTSPQLGGNLDLFGKTINGTGGINFTGVVTATTFIGDGSGLTGITASGTGVVIKNSGSTVGTAGTINFSDNLSVTPIVAGIVTVGVDTTGQLNVNNLEVTGITTISGITSIRDTVHFTYESNADINKKFFFWGNSTDTYAVWRRENISSPAFNLSDLTRLTYGSNQRVDTYANDQAFFWRQYASVNDNPFNMQSDFTRIFGSPTSSHNTRQIAAFEWAEGCSLYYTGTKRLQTSGVGVTITSQLDTTNIVASGVVTATTFKGALQGTSGTFSSGVDITGDLDVDGHTDLDNVSIAGVSTATGGSVFGNIQAGVGALNATIQKTDNGTLHLQYNKPGNLELCQGGGQVQVKNNFNVVGLSTLNGGAKLGNLSVGYDSLNVTIQPVSGQNTLHFNYNNGTEVRIGEGQTRSDLIVKGDIEPKTDSAFDLGTTSVRWRAGYFDIVSAGSSIAVGTGVTVETNGQATYTGIVTAQKFVGDGSGLTGITASGSGVVIKHDGSTVGTAGTINFGTNLDVSAISGGAVTITATDTQLSTEEVQDIVGAMFSGNTETNITATYQDSDGTIDLVATGSYTNSDVDSHLNVSGASSGQILSWNGSDYAWVADQTGGGTNVGITTNLSGTFTASAGSPSTINTFAYHDNDKVVEYTVYIKNGSDFQSQKLLAMRDGTTIHSTQFAVMFSSSLLVQLDATISSGNILLRATPETGVSGSTTYKIKREVM